MSDLGTQRMTVQSVEELAAVRANPRFQPYGDQGRPDVIGELYGMQVVVTEALWRAK